MTDFDRKPGSIDDPGGPGGQDVDVSRLPPGDTAGDTGAPGEPEIAELDLPGPDDPVAWNYVERGTEVVGTNGDRLGKVDSMLGTDEGIFHGIAVNPRSGGPSRMVPSSAVTRLTPSSVQIALDEDALRRLDEVEVG
jgi:hypothetical protein